MSSVTQRIDRITQPKGGYIPLSMFEKIQFDDGIKLNPKENVDSSIIGRTVDYVSRLYMSKNFVKVFHFPILGLGIAAAYSGRGQLFADEFMAQVWRDIAEGFKSDISIGALCRLASYDVWVRNTENAKKYHNPDTINSDAQTCANIRTLIIRTVKFYKKDIVKFDDGYLAGGFSDVVDCGDFDFLTSDTIFDLKCAVKSTMEKFSKNYTLQVLMYYLIGKHSGNNVFQNITKIGIFNPRFNTAYTMPVSKISKDIIEAVEKNVICYKN